MVNLLLPLASVSVAGGQAALPSGGQAAPAPGGHAALFAACFGAALAVHLTRGFAFSFASLIGFGAFVLFFGPILSVSGTSLTTGIC